MKKRSWKIIVCAIASMVAAVAFATLTGNVSNASTQSAVRSASATPSAPAVRPRVPLHLTRSQQQTLQGQMDEKIKKYKGTKISANQISYMDGDVVETLVIPGETRARAWNGEVVNLLDPSSLCRFEYACVWSGTNFTGSRWDRAKCETLQLSSVGLANSVSSIVNNQTSNTQTMLLNSSGQIVNASRAPSQINDLGVYAGDKATQWRVC